MHRAMAIVLGMALAVPGFALEVTATGTLPDNGVFVGDVGELSLRVRGAEGLVGNVGARKTQFIQYLNMSEGFARAAATSGADANLGSTIYQSTLDRFPEIPAWATSVTAHEPGRRAAFEATGRLHSPFREVGEFERAGAGEWRGEVTWTREPAANARMRLAVYLFAWLQDQPLTIVRPDGTVVDQLDGQRLRVWAAGEHGVFPAQTRLIFPLGVAETAIFTIHQGAALTSFNFGVHFGGFWVTPTEPGAEELRLTIERVSDPLQVVSGNLTATVAAHSGEAAIYHGPFKLIERVELVDGDARQGDVLPGTDSAWTGELVDAVTLLSGRLGTEWIEDVRPAESRLGGGAVWLAYARRNPDSRAVIRLTLPPVHVGQPIEWYGREPHGDEPPFRTGHNGSSAPLPAGGQARIALARGLAMTLSPSADTVMMIDPLGDDRALLSFLVPAGACDLAVTVDCGPKPDDWQVASYTERDYLRMREASTGVESGLQVRRDTPEPGDVQVVSPWWTVTQSAAKGGAITQIEFAHGREGGVLDWPIATSVVTSEAGRWCNWQCSDATLTVDRDGDRVIVTAAGKLADHGTPGPVGYEITCEYHPTFVRRTVRLTPDGPVPDVVTLAVAKAFCRDGMYDFVGGRTNPVWGRSVSEQSWSRRGYPEYVARFEHEVECLEMFPAQDLRQWAQVTGDPQDCVWTIHGMSISLSAYDRPEAPITLGEPLEFTHYIGLPPIPRANREKNAWHMLSASATDEQVARLAYTGLDSVHGLVGDPIRAGDQATWERATTGARGLVERCHRYGLEIIPYLYFLPMNQQNPIDAEHWDDWRVMPPAGNVACAASAEWREQYLASAQRLLEEGGYDGLYYDFVSIYNCETPAHGPVPHSTVDGLMATLEGTRELLGEDGMLIGHRGHQANTVIDSYLDGSVVFEHYAHPYWLPLDELTALNTFVGASRRDTCTKSLVCSIGGLNPRERRAEGPRVIDTDEILCKLALQGLFPYSFTGWSQDVLDRYFGLFARFRSVDFSRVTFMDHLHQPAIRSDDPYIRAAAYFGEDEGYVVVANPESDKPRDTNFRVDPAQFGWDARECAISEQPDGADARRISADELRAGVACSLPGYGYRVYLLRALDGDRPRVVSSTQQWEEREVEGAPAIVTHGPVGQECALVVAGARRPAAVTLGGADLPEGDWSWDAERGLVTVRYTCAVTDAEQVFALR